MSQSIVDVCNNALQYLGAARILSLADNSREARACNVAYDSNRRAELRKHPWNFAKTRVVLAADTTAPAFGYTYAFTLPSDCLKVIIPKDESLDWQIEGRKILTNWMNTPYGGAESTGASLSLLYIRDEQDTAQWDSTFFDMLALSMALDMCDDLTQSNTKKQLLSQQYVDARAEARAANAYENMAHQSSDPSWIGVRF
jgi:hypothetical protein